MIPRPVSISETAEFLEVFIKIFFLRKRCELLTGVVLGFEALIVEALAPLFYLDRNSN